ncbi:YmfQ family protein [Asaia astilbis]|uniref:YmfQ family protein n=1 Tax=Asaia astilbis TaxID=610244 RepID=UPI000471F75B|nr:YmfQ family protein [Asaia astilbis]
MFSTDDFRKAFLQLMPQGPAWSRAPDSLVNLLAQAWAATFARNSARAENLLTDAFPATTLELLPEWEASLGLPDPCSGPDPDIDQRRAQVVARLSDSGGSAVSYFKDFAAALGYEIAVEEYAPFRCGISQSGDALCNDEWAYCWVVTAPDGSAITGNADPLICELEARNPAHLVLRFRTAAHPA